MLEFYAARWKNLQEVQPNAAHYAIAKLEEKYNVINITQNIDDLLERAGCSNVWHLHGSLNSRKCEWHKSITNGDTNYVCDYASPHDKPVEFGDLCPKCGSQLRPDVVWFGEAVDLKDLDNLQPDVFITVGTSAQVYPAAGMLFTFRNSGQKYIIDPNPPKLDPRLHNYEIIKEAASIAMPKLAEKLRQ